MVLAILVGPVIIGVVVSVFGRLTAPRRVRLPPGTAGVMGIIGAYLATLGAWLFGEFTVAEYAAPGLITHVFGAAVAVVFVAIVRWANLDDWRPIVRIREAFEDVERDWQHHRATRRAVKEATVREQPNRPPPVQQQPTRPAPPPSRTATGIFLCYRRNDTRHVAGRLASELRVRYGRDVVFIDVESIGHGQNYRVRVIEAIRDSAVVLVLIGTGWAEEHDDHGRRLDDPDDNVRQEVESALRLSRALPVLIDGAPMPHRQRLPLALQRLADLNAASLRHDSWDTDAERLFRAIDSRLPAT